MPAAPINYYDLLQLNPHAKIETVERVYRMLAGRYPKALSSKIS